MSGIKASLGQIRFHSVYEALKEAGIPYEENDSSAILVWHDSIKDIDYFSNLLPWQVVNRIPNINVLCRKAPLARIIQKISPFFLEHYTFFPKTFILPFKNSEFIKSIKKKKSKWIIKPDSGSLGQGIIILEPGKEYLPDDTLSIAQEYIESFLLDEKKFDLRIYVLITSISPLEIFVYRDGLARFCSHKANEHSIYSQITNVSLNKDQINPLEFEEISQLISDIFPRLEKEYNINIKKLWEDIDHIIILTILSSHNFLIKGEEYQCPKKIYNKCFQILGFDILLDKNLKPFVLEINYRPSLEYHRGKERRMKVNMIKDSIRIATPLSIIQNIINVRKWSWENDNWNNFILNNKNLKNIINLKKKNIIKNSNFIKVFPTKNKFNILYNQILNKVHQLPIDFLPGFKIPLNFKNFEE